VELVHESFHKNDTFILAEVDSITCLLGIDGHRFLAENVLLCFCRLYGPFSMHTVGQWYIDCINIGIVQQSFIRIINLNIIKWVAGILAQGIYTLIRFLRRPAGNRCQTGLGSRQDGWRHRVKTNSGSAENPPRYHAITLPYVVVLQPSECTST
jgi:hypothetical protein